MDAPFSRVFSPQTFQELFSTWSRFPDALPCAGGTGFIHAQGRRVPLLAPHIISLDKMEDLKKISRTERYLEIGAMVKLDQVLNLGKIVPEAITRCFLRIADPQVRSQATIGGNICFPSGNLDACLPMVALDAQYELRTAGSSRWISAARFSSPDGPPVLATGELLTRIRIPLTPWSFTWYSKFNDAVNNNGSSILFIMKNEKTILTTIRIIYSGKSILREKNSETMFSGKRLPLDRKDAEAFVECWRTYLSGIDDMGENVQAELTKTQIINFIKTMLRHISD